MLACVCITSLHLLLPSFFLLLLPLFLLLLLLLILILLILLLFLQSQIYMMEQSKRSMELQVSRMQLQSRMMDKAYTDLQLLYQNERRSRKKYKERIKMFKVCCSCIFLYTPCPLLYIPGYLRIPLFIVQSCLLLYTIAYSSVLLHTPVYSCSLLLILVYYRALPSG